MAFPNKPPSGGLFRFGSWQFFKKPLRRIDDCWRLSVELSAELSTDKEALYGLGLGLGLGLAR